MVQMLIFRMILVYELDNIIFGDHMMVEQKMLLLFGEKMNDIWVLELEVFGRALKLWLCIGIAVVR